MKKLLFAANWKLNKNPAQTKFFFEEFKQKLPSHLQEQVIFFPPATNLETTAAALASTSIKWGSQNCYFQTQGAFTGEISAQTIKEMGGHFVLVGHSERRQYFGETDEMMARKVLVAQSVGVTPMLCIGETLEERKANKTNVVLKKQIVEVIKQLAIKAPLVIAYEPVWAIGTGVVAEPAQVLEAHAFIRTTLNEFSFPETLPILYGGSVKGSNAKELGSIPHVNGFLVGGASLEVKSFLEICSV